MRTVFKPLCLVLLVVLSFGGCATMQSRWKDTEAINTISAYEEFLRRYPQGTLANEARSRIEKLYFDQAQAKNTIAAYDEFLRRYPQGRLADDTRSRREKLYWKDTEAINTIAAYEDFLRRYPQGTLAGEARSRREKLYAVMIKDWENAQSANTVSAYKQFLELYPTGEFSEKARSYLTEQRLEGWVQKVDISSNTFTIKTAMGKQEILSLDQETQVNEKDKILSVENLKNGDSVSIQYLSLPKKLLSRKISIGYSVSHCSCGASCTCPLSRGCRVIRY